MNQTNAVTHPVVTGPKTIYHLCHSFFKQALSTFYTIIKTSKKGVLAQHWDICSSLNINKYNYNQHNTISLPS